MEYPSAVGDIDNDGKPEIIFTSDDMSVYCLDENGSLLWKYITKGGLQPIYPGGFKRLLFHPVVEDINDDGYDEIVVTSCLYDKPNWSAVYCINHDGNLVWKFNLQHGVGGPASVGDIDNDGKPEIIFGDIDGTVYALNNDGSILWKTSLPRFYFSTDILSGAPSEAEFTPSIADLDGDGYNEIVLAAWSHGIFIFNHNGVLLKQWVYPLGRGGGFAGASIADIDGDGDLEIIFGMAGKTGILGRLGIIDQPALKHVKAT